jgi:hypothetical protein
VPPGAVEDRRLTVSHHGRRPLHRRLR